MRHLETTEHSERTSKHSKQASKQAPTIPPPRRQTPGRQAENNAGEELELQYRFEIAPKSGPATATATATAQLWTCTALHQAQSQHSSLGPASGLAVYHCKVYPLALGHSCSAQNEPSSITLGPAKSLPGLILGMVLGLWARTIHHYLELLLPNN